MKISKDLNAASATPLILSILMRDDSYGYHIIQKAKELSGGTLEWTDGMLYPVLHRLEKKGFIESYWQIAESGRKRKYYKILDLGIKEREAQKVKWEAVNVTLQKAWGSVIVGNY